MDCTNTTVRLRDLRAHTQLQNPIIFEWPKRELWPYYARTQPTAVEVHPPPHDPEPAEMPILSEIEVANAVLLARPLENQAHNPASNVRNFEYLVFKIPISFLNTCGTR